MENYITVSQEQQDDLIIATYKAQETDLYIHRLNKERYEDMLQTLPEGQFRTRVEGLLAETNERIAEIEAIINSVKKQMPVSERVESSLLRLKAKEDSLPTVK